MLSVAFAADNLGENQVEALSKISIKIHIGEFVVIHGPSGSGKSTLLHILGTLDLPTLGTLTLSSDITLPEESSGISVPLILSNSSSLAVSEKKIAAIRQKIGFVFQDHNLFNHLTVIENICLVLEKVHGRKRADILPMIKQLLEDFDLTESMDKLPHQLSGGQSQRVSIVRALSINPELILLDEPTSSLDPILTYEVLNAIKKLSEEKKDFVIVTHEIGFAKQVADYIVFMDDGCIVEHGDVSILNNPKTDKLQDFLQKVLPFNQDTA